MMKVLFVCKANVCRSPMAEAIFNALAADTGAPYEARSAGVAALVDKTMAPYAKVALEEVGIYANGHRARQVNEAMLQDADLVLAMTPPQAVSLRRIPNASFAKIYTLTEYAIGAPDREGISDPYGQPLAAYRASIRRILECVDLLVDRLGRG